MKSKIFRQDTNLKGLSLWMGLVLVGLLSIGCEDEQPTVPRGGEPPTPQKVEPTAPDKASSEQAQAPEKAGQPAPVADGQPAKEVAKKAPEPAKEEPIERPPAKRPNTLTPDYTKNCGATPGLQLAQELDFSWKDKQEKIRVEITRPQSYQILRSGRLRLEARIIGFKTAVRKAGGGNRLRVLLDNEQPRDWYDANERAMSIDGLAPGLHTVRVFAVNAWGESIKAPKAFDAINFYVRTDKNQPLPVDFSQPVLSYSQPRGTYTGAAADRVLLDFHLGNVQLSSTGARVRLELNGEAMDIAAWGPIWLEGMPEGKHTVVLSLMDAKGNPIPGPHNQRIEGNFTIQRKAGN